jgi:hypothetical protein
LVSHTEQAVGLLQAVSSDLKAMALEETLDASALGRIADAVDMAIAAISTEETSATHH